ncbi:MAG: flagellar hook-basal body complex protein [Lachnospiraceae bacterium]|nr:flagellar hook-basal body complex protein [Lachnospiraceae bacterium]
MMRSMYSGVAGLKTHQTKMDVIGNNIANVNTVAYKSQSVTFSELMYQTTQNASGANALTGTAGINARQIGLGVKMGAINTAITTEGASQTTNNPFDIRITGDSFFIVSNATETFFTRDGSFYVDGAGNLAMTSNGYNVMGWQVDPETMDIKKDTVSALRVMSPENMTYPPEATTKAYVAGILDKHDTDVTGPSGKTMNLQFYDNLGYSYTAKMIVRNTEDEGVYTVELDKILDSENVPLDTENFPFGGGPKVNKTTTIGLQGDYSWTDDGAGNVALVKKTAGGGTEPIYTMDGDGPSAEEWSKIAEAYGVDASDANALATFKTYTIDYENTYTNAEGNPVTEVVPVSIAQLLTQGAQISLDGKTRNVAALDILTAGATAQDKLKSITFDSMEMFGTVELVFDETTGKFSSINGTTSVDLNLSSLDPAGRFSDITIDFSNTTMFNNSGVSTITATNGDTKGLGTGRKLGQMSGISISNDGKIYASYDNGMSRLLGQIAVATFSNASGLEKDGDNLYKATQNSGDFDGIGVDITADGGYMTTGILEMSNVDLSAEFTEMITTQRGFQANSRIITVSDTLLEELINLKR